MEYNVTLRPLAGEKAYQEAIKSGQLRTLSELPSIMEWAHWRLVENNFPYSIAFNKHHMLVAKRPGVGERFQLTNEERQEFEGILRYYVYPNYDLWFENCPKRRSVPAIYHVHVVTYLPTRKDMQL